MLNSAGPLILNISGYPPSISTISMQGFDHYSLVEIRVKKKCRAFLVLVAIKWQTIIYVKGSLKFDKHGNTPWAPIFSVKHTWASSGQGAAWSTLHGQIVMIHQSLDKNLQGRCLFSLNSFKLWWYYIHDTPRKINMSPEKGPFQKEHSLPTGIFQGIC